MDKVELSKIQFEMEFEDHEMCLALNISARTYDKWLLGERKMTGANHTAVLAVQFLEECGLLEAFMDFKAKYDKDVFVWPIHRRGEKENA